MSQCKAFRNASEIQFQMSQSGAALQGSLRSFYDEVLGFAADTAKVTPKEMHTVILKRSAPYCAARSSGNTKEEAFAIAGNQPTP